MSFEIKPEKLTASQQEQVAELIPEPAPIPLGTSTTAGLVIGQTNDRIVALGLNSLSGSNSSQNVAIGNNALRVNQQQGNNNSAVGYDALRNNTTGDNNVATGALSLRENTTGFGNVAVGSGASMLQSDGYYNVAVGSNSLSNNVASENTAVGAFALQSNTTGNVNIAAGTKALQSNTTGFGNVAIGGTDALISNTTGHRNTAIGTESLRLAAEGSNNVAIGSRSGTNLGTGSENTLIGSDAGGFGSGVVLTTGTNNTVIGFNSRTSSSSISNTVTLGNSSVTTLRCEVTSITSLSDERDKANIVESKYGLDLVNQLRPVEFEWNMRDGGKVGQKDIGFIAQDLVKVEDALEAHETLALTYRDNPEKLEASYGRLVPVLVKAIQELSAQISELQNGI